MATSELLHACVLVTENAPLIADWIKANDHGAFAQIQAAVANARAACDTCLGTGQVQTRYVVARCCGNGTPGGDCCGSPDAEEMIELDYCPDCQPTTPNPAAAHSPETSPGEPSL